ncbi:MAG: adenine deaminase [Bacteroidia bacterium]|jgi:adenine deaminase|nr:adenine deaminase [Bacteroidia bacterium]MBP7244453.1 adenine deaminase [Bacteroidia bacterium]
MTTTIAGIWVNILERKTTEGVFTIKDGKIYSFEEQPVNEKQYILPGFIDAHIHIESSMLVPYEFARIALTHGTVATISDPHEIANVLGVDGVYYMLENAKDALLKFNFGAPSCVPATTYETAGALLDATDIETLLQRDDIKYLSEMMNYPGVLFKDPEVMEKIAITKKYNKPIDGHAPGLRGGDAKNYIDAGISTDHECFTLEEALEKIQYGMKILIREGSAARNFEALHPLLKLHPRACMFCSDDKHPDELLLGHINQLVKKSISLGYDLFDVLYAACIHPIEHYKLNVGQLRVGDAADFILCEDLTEFKVAKTYIDGICVAENGKSILPPKKHNIVNHFSTTLTQPQDFILKKTGNKIRVIEAYDGQLITGETQVDATDVNGDVVSDIANDILKIAVVNRYSKKPPAIAFIKNFGLKKGAIASSVAHDSHNIIVVGIDDISISKAVNLIIEKTGGLSLVDGEEIHTIALPVAGLMSDLDCESIGLSYSTIDRKAKELGSKLRAPYMSLSFMALLVIPQLKLSDKGLFDGKSFQFSDLFCE